MGSRRGAEDAEDAEEKQREVVRFSACIPCIVKGKSAMEDRNGISRRREGRKGKAGGGAPLTACIPLVLLRVNLLWMVEMGSRGGAEDAEEKLGEGVPYTIYGVCLVRSTFC